MSTFYDHFLHLCKKNNMVSADELLIFVIKDMTQQMWPTKMRSSLDNKAFSVTF